MALITYEEVRGGILHRPTNILWSFWYHSLALFLFSLFKSLPANLFSDQNGWRIASRMVDMLP